MDRHVLLPGIFPTQGLNPGLLCPGTGRQVFTTSATGEAHERTCCNADVLCPDLECERKGNKVLDFAEKTSQDIPLLDLNMLC